MSDRYILDGHKAVACDDFTEWAKWFESGKRTVCVETRGDTTVSTVFLALDHSFGNGKPVLFETMVFGGDGDQDMNRYHTWEEAEAGHTVMCDKAFKETNP